MKACTALIVSTALICAPALAIPVQHPPEAPAGALVHLTPEMVRICNAEGGCKLRSEQWMDLERHLAYERGRASCRSL